MEDTPLRLLQQSLSFQELTISRRASQENIASQADLSTVPPTIPQTARLTQSHLEMVENKNNEVKRISDSRNSVTPK